MAVRMCVVLVDGGGAKAVQKFVSLNIAAITVLAVTILPARPSSLNTPAQPVKRPRGFRKLLCFYARVAPGDSPNLLAPPSLLNFSSLANLSLHHSNCRIAEILVCTGKARLPLLE